MRQEFPARVKMEALARSKGRCEGSSCGTKLTIAKYHFDHVIADGLGGKPTLDNCAVLCWACHRVKTSESDVPAIAKAKRREIKHLVGRQRKPKSRYVRHLDGSVTLRNP